MNGNGAGKLRKPRETSNAHRMPPLRDPKYLSWIRTQPCLVCGVQRGIEASHTGPHGLGQKSSDKSAIPLCNRHHRTGGDSYHRLGPRKFSEAHGLDIPAIVRRLNAKPHIRIEAGKFVGHFEDERYDLGDIKGGLESAVRKVVHLRRELHVPEDLLARGRTA